MRGNEAEKIKYEGLQVNDDGSFIVNSLFALNQARIIKAKNILLTDGDPEAFRDFFLNRLTWIETLEIEINHKNNKFLDYINSLVVLVKRKKLKNLIIHSQGLSRDRVDLIVNKLEFYSNLKKLTVFTDESINVSNKCNRIIRLNADIDKLRDALPKIKSVCSKINSIDLNALDRKQIQYCIKLGEKYPSFSEYQAFFQDSSYDFHGELEDHNPSIMSFSRLWSLENIVSRNDTDRLKLRHGHQPIDINQICSYDQRLIDIALNNNAIKVTEWLIQQNAEITLLYKPSDQELLPRLNHNELSRTSAFPFRVCLDNLQQKDSRLLGYILHDKNAYYDALAWFIVADEQQYFEQAIEHSTVVFDLDKRIENGFFNNFTLLQLLFYYKRTKIFFYIVNKLTIPELSRNAYANYPVKDLFQHSGWTVWEMMIYNGLYNELEQLLNANKFSQFPTSNDTRMFGLLFYGARDTFSKKVRDMAIEQTDQILIPFKQCLKLLMDRVNYKLEDLNLKYSLNDAIPIMHFCVIHGIWPLIEQEANAFSYEKFLEKATIIMTGNQVLNINLFQCAVVLNVKDIRAIFDIYQQRNLSTETIRIIQEPLVSYNNVNLFQYAIIYKRNTFLNLIIPLVDENEIINQPFPDNHPDYPNCRPIHIAILDVFKTKDDNLLRVLLQAGSLDLTQPFPDDEIGIHRLGGLHPLSAVLHANPLKKVNYSRYKVAEDLFDKLLKRHDEFPSWFKEKRFDILTEALAQAVLHSGAGHLSYTKEIKKLLTADNTGKSPFQNLNILSGTRIIDLADERGLLPLFLSYINTSYTPANRKKVTIIPNERESDFNKVTGNSYHVYQDKYAVISLVINKGDDIAASIMNRHIFLVIETVEAGRACAYFFDFVEKPPSSRKGWVRGGEKYKYTGNLDEIIVLKCEIKLMKMKGLSKNFIEVRQWQVPIAPCNKIMESIEKDIDAQEKNPPSYMLYGGSSTFTSSNDGDNCYSWLRKKLLDSGERSIICHVKDTDSFVDKLIVIPRTDSFYNGATNFFKTNQKFIGTAAVLGIGMTLCKMSS